MGLGNSLTLSEPQFSCLQNGHGSCSLLFANLQWGIGGILVWKHLISFALPHRWKFFLWWQYRSDYFILLSNTSLGVFSFMQRKRIHFRIGTVIGNNWLVLHMNLTLCRCHIVKCHTLCGFPLPPFLSHPNKESPCNSSQRTWLIFLDTNKQRTWWSQSFVKIHILGHLSWCFLRHLFFCGKEKSQHWLPNVGDLNTQDFLIELFSSAESYLHLFTRMRFPQRWWTRRHDFLQGRDRLVWAAPLGLRTHEVPLLRRGHHSWNISPALLARSRQAPRASVLFYLDFLNN